MWAGNTWRGLAATYAAVAGIQLYIAVTSGVMWAVVLSAASALVAVACGIAAWRTYGKTRTAGIAEPTRSDVSTENKDTDRSCGSPLSAVTRNRHSWAGSSLATRGERLLLPKSSLAIAKKCPEE